MASYWLDNPLVSWPTILPAMFPTECIGEDFSTYQ